MAGSPVSTSVLVGDRGSFVRILAHARIIQRMRERHGIYGVLPHLLPNQAHLIGLSIFAPPEWLRRWRWPEGLDWIQKGFVLFR